MKDYSEGGLSSIVRYLITTLALGFMGFGLWQVWEYEAFRVTATCRSATVLQVAPSPSDQDIILKLVLVRDGVKTEYSGDVVMDPVQPGDSVNVCVRANHLKVFTKSSLGFRLLPAIGGLVGLFVALMKTFRMLSEKNK